MLTRPQIDSALAERGAIADIGQIDKADRRWLDKRAKQGELIKYRGYWNTRNGFGLGPLKTCYRLPEPA